MMFRAISTNTSHISAQDLPVIWKIHNMDNDRKQRFSAILLVSYRKIPSIFFAQFSCKNNTVTRNSHFYVCIMQIEIEFRVTRK